MASFLSGRNYGGRSGQWPLASRRRYSYPGLILELQIYGTMTSKENEDILNAALDELDEGSDDDEDSIIRDQGDVQDEDTNNPNKGADSFHQDETEKPRIKQQRPVFGPVLPPVATSAISREKEEEMLDTVMGELESILVDDSTGSSTTNPISTSQASQTKSSRDAGGGGEKSFSTELDSAISNLLGEISKSSSELPTNANPLEGMEEGGALAEEFFKQFEESMRIPSEASGNCTNHAGGNTGGNSEEGEDMMGDVVNGMMKQLLGKDLMYEPMKEMCDRFPKWLAENKAKLKDEEYQRYAICQSL